MSVKKQTIFLSQPGPAISAELGTMMVGEEIDALRTMGINETRFLVVPRVYAITVLCARGIENDHDYLRDDEVGLKPIHSVSEFK